jgi:hypothetical protein
MRAHISVTQWAQDELMKLTHTKAAVVALIAAAALLPAFTSSVQAQPLPANSTTQFQRAQQAL